jgi:fumarylacetoacetase
VNLTLTGNGSSLTLSSANGTSGTLNLLGGRNPVSLPNGETRRYLEDGDDIVFRAHCAADGAVPIGFGECRGRVGG